jgi:hypothetical protein
MLNESSKKVQKKKTNKTKNRNKKRKKKSPIDWLDKHSGAIIAIFTIVLACATILYVICTNNILNQTEKQVEITNEILLHSKKIAEITNRPYVGLGSYNVVQGQNKFSFELSLINVTSHPATEVMIEYDWIPVYEGWILSQEKEGKIEKINRNLIDHIFMGKPTTIFPKVIFTKRFTIGYNHTIDYWVEKYKEISIIITIYYRGIEPKELKDFHKTIVKLVYKPHKKGWDIEESTVY